MEPLSHHLPFLLWWLDPVLYIISPLLITQESWDLQIFGSGSGLFGPFLNLGPYTWEPDLFYLFLQIHLEQALVAIFEFLMSLAANYLAGLYWPCSAKPFYFLDPVPTLSMYGWFFPVALLCFD